MVGIAVLAGVVGEVAPLVLAVTQSEGLDDFIAHATLVEIAEANGTAHLVVEKQVGKIFLGKLTHMEQAVALVLTLFLLLGHFLFLYRDVVFAGQVAQCFVVGVVLVFHKETHSIARLATAKTFEDAFAGGDIKRGSFLVVERAAANMVGTPFFERHKLTHHLFDMGGIHDAVDGLLINHLFT